MPKVLVYRDHLLPASEREFMRRQYVGFERLEPLWTGRRVDSDLDPAIFQTAPLKPWEGFALKTLGFAPPLRALASIDAVAVHAQFGRGGALALPLAKRLGRPLVVTFHGGDVHKRAHYRLAPTPALLRLRRAALSAYASRFVCVSSSVRDRLISRGFPSEKAVVLPIGVDTIDKAYSAAPRAGLLFVGRFVEMKGLDVLAAAVRRLRARGSSEPVTIIGDGPNRAQVRAAFDSDVRLLGWLPPGQVREAMRAARALCVPSVVARSGEAEGLPSVAVEAMSVGTPVIGSSEAGLDGVVDDGVSGLIFPSRDAETLAAQMEHLVGAPSLYESMGRAALARATKDFDARRQSRRLEALIEEVVKKHALLAV